MKKLILEGCNGEWAQRYYLPHLIGEAAKGAIELWAVDIEGKIKFSNPKLEKDWQIAQSKNRANYLNKKKDIQAYDRLSDATHVFVVAPDRFHSKIAERWLDRLAPGGKIFIEKPLDASVEQAKKLRRNMAERNIVYGFDHYLAKAAPFLQDKASYLEKLGKISKTDFHILEASEVPPQQEKTLNKGMIFDLFCHVLALACAVMNHNSTRLETKLRAVKLEEAKAARYVGSPISGETFAWIKFMINSDIEVDSAVGKCVGTSDNKFMKLYGSNGNIKLDFIGDEFSVFGSQVRQRKQGRLDSKPVESFLGRILGGKGHPLSTPGVLSFDAALEILKTLDEAKERIDNMSEYRCKDSIGKILAEFLKK